MMILRVEVSESGRDTAESIHVERQVRPPSVAAPIVRFASTESFARVLSAGNRELLRTIADKAPESLDDLAEMTGRAAPNLSRTLKTMERYGLVRMERQGRKLAPKVIYDRVELALPLTARGEVLEENRR